ncbi:MAG: hypothetical protein JSW11_00475 [Candidatus Heimdallarchaeota archaeon]|nr:MAG: hypothetical protein JSW11_00475 [Candidatus Heimdallarchaeota archaeon]
MQHLVFGANLKIEIKIMKKFLITLSIVLCIILFFIGGPIWVYYNNTKHICIINDPPEITGGFIGDRGGLIRFGSPSYYLSYKGKLKNSDEVCEKWVRVTEYEYDYRIYGRDDCYGHQK